MTKPPTAEEVLGLYFEWQKIDQEFGRFCDASSDLEGQTRFAMDVIHAMEKFSSARDRWQAAQGPVTREWFVERFGATYYWPKQRVMLKCDNDGVLLTTHMSAHFHNIRLDNPTRSDIETLVRVLGGDDAKNKGE